MFGLTRDFMQQDGIHMLLGEPEGMPVGRLNMVQARMLMNTDIPHHLRLLLREIDLKVTLEYAVLRKKMLSHLLKSEKLTMTSLFSILLQIAQGMEDGRLYMLRAEQYAVHEDYIFIEGSLQKGKVYLTYIPIQSNEAVSKPGERFRSLIMVLMASVTELAGSGVQRLLQYCGEEDFTPGGLKGLLSELLTEEVPIISEGRAPLEGKESLVNEVAAPHRAIFEQQVEKTLNTVTSAAPWIGSHPKHRIKEEEREFDIPEDNKLSNPSSSGSKTYLLLGCLLGDALLWKFLYLDHPKPLWLAVCGIATIILAVLSWMLWSGRLRLGDTKEEEQLEEEVVHTSFGTGRKELEWNFGRNPVTAARPVAKPPMAEQFPSDPMMSVPSRPYDPKPYDSISEKFASGPTSEPILPTTLLSREATPEQVKGKEMLGRSTPYLKRSGEEEEENEIIELNRASFIIGRSADVAQYIEKSEGVSRVHAEISRSQGGYILKDLDSRNGTLFQGEAMIPYKEYPLTDGSVFKIVKGSYTFHLA